MTKSECLSEFGSFQYLQMFLAFQRPYCVNKDLLVMAEEGSLCDLKTFIIWGTCSVSCVVWINCSDQVRDMSVVCNYVFTLFFPLQKHLFPLKCIAIAVFHINVIHSILKINDLPSLILTNNLRVHSFSLHSCCHHGEPQVLATNFAHQNFRDSPQDAYCLMLFQ